MERIKIGGGIPLRGEVNIQGSKNSVLPIIAAAVLNKGTSVLHNCPDIIDVQYMRRILESIGCDTEQDKNTLIIHAAGVDSWKIPTEYARAMRSSIILLGGLIGRTGHAEVSFPGGCVIGARPIDLHIRVLEQMGVVIKEEEGILTASSERLKSCDVTFPFQSVGAVENAVLAAVCAEGDSTLRNCAREPEITELCRFLNKMGAEISGGGTDTITIRGKRELHDVEYEIVSDRIVAGTYAMAAIGTRGKITMLHAPAEHLQSLKEITEKLGGSYQSDGTAIQIDGTHAGKSLPFIETVPYPGFPTDMQSQLIAALAVAEGESRVKESIFEARFKAAAGLREMGADIVTQGDVAVIRGVRKLCGTCVKAEELRGGAALVIAGLIAEGKTEVGNRHFIDRGYEDICRDLRALGAQIEG